MKVREFGTPTISEGTWKALVSANDRAVEAGWAAPGVFGTGVGPRYHAGGILWVGKSAGPKGSLVGSTRSQSESMAASTAWMVNRENRKSQFWQMVEKLDPSRQSLGWTNMSKMDRVGGSEPPSVRQWAMIANESSAALVEEIDALKPGVIVMTTGDFAMEQVAGIISQYSFEQRRTDFDDGWTRLYQNDVCHLITTRHPQGWTAVDQNRVVAIAKQFIKTRAE